MTIAFKPTKARIQFDEIRVTEAGVNFWLRGQWMMMLRPEPGQIVKVDANGWIEGELK